MNLENAPETSGSQKNDAAEAEATSSTQAAASTAA